MINIIVIVNNSSIINIPICSHPQHTNWQLSCVYGPTISSLKAQFWDSLASIENAWNGLLCILGDFNLVLDKRDKASGQLVPQSSSSGFRGFVQDNGLIDLGFSGPQFIWYSKRTSTTNVQERLDRKFFNDSWRILVSHAYVTHLIALNSHHKLILLCTTPNLQSYVDHSDSKLCG